jgi:hypothetical protein
MMESEVGWGVAIALIAVAAAHIAEESVADFRSFFNMQWFAGNQDCPVTPFKGLVVDKIGLFLPWASSRSWAPGTMLAGSSLPSASSPPIWCSTRSSVSERRATRRGLQPALSTSCMSCISSASPTFEDS